MKPATRHCLIVVVALFAILACLAWAGVARGASVATLQAERQTQVWESRASYPDDRPLNVSIRVRGEAVDQRGSVTGRCGYVLLIRGLAVKLTTCGGGKFQRSRSRVRIAYMGTLRFTVRIWAAR